MTIHIRQAFINDPESSYHGKTMDLVIESGIIKEIQTSLAPADAVKVEAKGLKVSPGWVDLFSFFGDPGLEQKETLFSGAQAAAAGGITDVFVLPNTRPAIDSKSQVEYILHKSIGLPVKVYPIGAVSHNSEGHELAEMYDMRASGAIAFSDGIHPLQSAGLLLKALQYVKAIGAVIIQLPDDRSIMPHGQMHEGVVSTRIGLPGKPRLAEELMVYRDIELARYADSRIHFAGITSPVSIDHIRKAKAAGLQVTCSVAPHHLFFTDSDLMGYDTNLKVFPPLRPMADVELLRKAVMDGTIDCFASHHLPQERDAKNVEFEFAAPGMISLETYYAAIRTSIPALREERLIQMLSHNPRKIFGLEAVTIEKGQPATLTFYQSEEAVQVTPDFFRSLSDNSPFMGKELKGKVLGIFAKGNLTLKATYE